MSVAETKRNIAGDIGTAAGGGTCTYQSGTVTYSGGTFDLATGGSLYFDGNFHAGTYTTFLFKDCLFYTSDTVKGRMFATMSDGYTITFDNCDFGDATHSMTTEKNTDGWPGDSVFMFLGAENQNVTIQNSRFNNVTITEDSTALIEFTSRVNNTSELTIDNVSFTNVSVDGNFIERGSDKNTGNGGAGTSSEKLKLEDVTFSGSTIRDYLFSENGGVTISGTNTFDTRITTDNVDYTSQIDYANAAVLKFTNTSEIACEMSSCAGTMSLVFDNSEAVNFKYLGTTMTGSEITSNAINTKTGTVGNFGSSGFSVGTKMTF